MRTSEGVQTKKHKESIRAQERKTRRVSEKSVNDIDNHMKGKYQTGTKHAAMKRQAKSVPEEYYMIS